MPSERIAPAQTPRDANSPWLRAVRSIIALTLREMSTRYGRSPGGYLWAVLEPVGGIVILAIGFSLMVRTPPLGNSFILFYATGFGPFTLFMGVSNTVSQSLKFSRPLLSYPAVSWFDAIAARLILNAMTGIVVTGVTLLIMSIASGETISVDAPALMASMGLAVLLGMGVGLINCFLMGIVPIWANVWSIITRPLFIASGVIFLPDNLPSLAQTLIWANPVTHPISMMRTAFYPYYYPENLSPLYVVGVSLALSFLGLLLLRRWHRHILQM